MPKKGIDTIEKLIYVLEYRRTQGNYTREEKEKLQQVIDFCQRQIQSGKTLVDIIYWVNQELDEEVK